MNKSKPFSPGNYLKTIDSRQQIRMNINVYCQFKYTPINNVDVPSEEGSWNFTLYW